MFQRLLQLYENTNSNTPLEDFTTEILAGLLEKDPHFYNAFITQILKLQADAFSIATQKNYRLNDGTYAVIDLVLSNSKSLIFIENKVESTENINQLEKYAQLLNEIEPQKQKYLRYCTKYVEPKDENRHHFLQYRWYEVANLLPTSNNPLAHEFYQFLKTYNMSQKMNIQTKDLFYLENLKETLGFLDNFLEQLKPNFEQYFGAPSSPDYSGQMRKYGRYTFYKNNIFGENLSEIGAGFNFNHQPSAYVWMWIAASNTKAKAFNQYLENNRALFHEVRKDYCDIQIPLNQFIGKDDGIKLLHNWFTECFEKINQFKAATEDLNWKKTNQPNTIEN